MWDPIAADLVFMPIEPLLGQKHCIPRPVRRLREPFLMVSTAGEAGWCFWFPAKASCSVHKKDWVHPCIPVHVQHM